MGDLTIVDAFGTKAIKSPSQGAGGDITLIQGQNRLNISPTKIDELITALQDARTRRDNF